MIFEIYILLLLIFALIYRFFIAPPIHEAGHALICKLFGGDISHLKEGCCYAVICLGKEKSEIANILYSLGGILAELFIPLVIILYSFLVNKGIYKELELISLALIFSIGFNFLTLSYVYDLVKISSIFSNPIPHWIIGLLLVAIAQQKIYYLIAI